MSSMRVSVGINPPCVTLYARHREPLILWGYAEVAALAQELMMALDTLERVPVSGPGCHTAASPNSSRPS
jgi:hypothetical protein